MRRMRVLIVVGLVVAAAAATGVAVSAAWSHPKPPDGAMAARPGLFPGVNFVSACRFSHRSMDDPIVFPRRPGASHDHTFVGNTSTDAYSTLGRLLAAETTCQRPGDTAAYWAPTLFDPQGSPVEPVGATVYYRRNTTQPLNAFPAGLRVIAGSAMADGPQSLRVTFWNCGIAGGVPRSSEIPTCPDGPEAMLRLHVNFPSCWNGRALDSRDHASHMAYPEAGRCPAGYPIEVPAISLILRYPVSGGPGYTLASGGQHTAHADFFNAWDQRALQRLVDRCLNGLRHCGRG